jgi:RNA polymerase sigma-70 factor (ECF subfamily)
MQPANLELLYDQHATAMYAFALRLSGEPQASEDLVQNVFCSIAAKPTLALLNPRSFLLRCLYRAWVDSIRRKQTEVRVLQQLALEPMIAPEDLSPEEAESISRLLAALPDLPEEQRTVLHLKLWENQTFAEIGSILGVSPNTAASRYRYATEKLRTLVPLPTHS